MEKKYHINSQFLIRLCVTYFMYHLENLETKYIYIKILYLTVLYKSCKLKNYHVNLQLLIRHVRYILYVFLFLHSSPARQI